MSFGSHPFPSPAHPTVMLSCPPVESVLTRFLAHLSGDVIERSRSRIRSSETWRVSPSLHSSTTCPVEADTGDDRGGLPPPIESTRCARGRGDASARVSTPTSDQLLAIVLIAVIWVSSPPRRR